MGASPNTSSWSKYYQEYEPRREGDSETWICVDDRPAQLLVHRLKRISQATSNAQCAVAERQADYGNTFLQTQGGASGLGMNRSLAAETERPGSITSQGRGMDVHTGIVVAHLLKEKIQAERHGSTSIDTCGREAHDTDVSDYVLNKPELVYPLAAQINPELTTDQYEANAAARHRIIEAGLSRDNKQLDPRLNAGWTEHDSGLVVPPVDKIALVQEPHTSDQFNVNHGRSAFLSAEACAAGQPAYNLSIGRLGAVNHELNKHLPPVAEHTFLSHVAMDAAGTVLVLQAATGMEFDLNVLNV